VLLWSAGISHGADLAVGNLPSQKPPLPSGSEAIHFGGFSGVGSSWTFKSSQSLKWTCAGNAYCRNQSDTIRVPNGYCVSQITVQKMTGANAAGTHLDISVASRGTTMPYRSDWGNNDTIQFYADVELRSIYVSAVGAHKVTCLPDGYTLHCQRGACAVR